MRNASPALIAFLNSGTEFYVADLLTIAQQGGTITRLTSAPANVTAVSQFDNASHLFAAGGVTFTRDRTTMSVGLEVDAMNITLMTDPAVHLLGGVPWPQAARQGAFDGARIMLERAYMPGWGDTSAGTLIVFSGSVGPLRASRNTVAITVNSDLAILSMPMPRNLYGPGCLHALYDTGCTLLRSAFTVAGTAHAGSTASSIATGLAQADHYFELGAIAFTSGVNAGLTRIVKTHVAGAVGLTVPFPAAPAVGDAFSIYPGCDKSQATCTNKFNNAVNFRGFPYIPVPETAA
jgi:uncharacterized phage protein (TIGR02218 family)